MIATATQLLARAEGLPLDQGEEHCLFCGAPCDRQRPASGHLKASFTAFSSLACPASDYLCVGCTRATAERGKQRPEGGPFGLAKPRNYSWVLSADPQRAAWFTKSQISELQAELLDPPAPPFAIVVAVSGQKHLLAQAPVCRQRDPLIIQFEEERITCYHAALRDRLQLTAALLPFFSRSALAGHLSLSAIVKQVTSADEDLLTSLQQWQAVQHDSLSALALFLTPTPEKPQ